MGPRLRGPRDSKSAFTRVYDALCVAGCPSRGRPDCGTLASFGQKAARACPHAEEHGCVHSSLRCDASRSMNAPDRWPSSSFETRARTFVLCGTAAACALLRMRTSTALVVVSHDVKQPISFPRRISAPGVCDFASLTPHRGVGGAPRNVRVLGGTPV